MTPRAATLRILAVLVFGSVGLVGAAAGPDPQRGANPPAATPPPPTRPADVTVTIPPDLLARAGIETAPARTGASAEGVRIPATVQPHGYRQAAVSSNLAGRILSVSAELGQHVAPGDPLAEVYSPEAAETQRAFVGLQADLTFADQQIKRLDRLVQIGAASQQELDGVRAQRTRLAADLEATRARLVLFGLTSAQLSALSSTGAISPTATVVAPIGGTVTSRAANAGQTVDASTPLFTIVDLDTVWIVGDVYERDLAAVRLGSAAIVTGAAFPGESFAGRVAYVDPQVAPDTRTVRVRVELSNPGGRLRLGMLMEMNILAPARAVVMIPRTAVQTIGGVTVVYLADARRAGTFLERSVRLGGGRGADVEVAAGIQAGDVVVTSGSFLVRAERDRGNLAPPRPVPPVVAPATPGPVAPSPAPPIIDIAVTADGFSPLETRIPANTRIRLRFTRRVEDTCVTEVVFESLKIRKPLAVGKPVIIDLPPLPPGRVEFSCGMKMVWGHLIVEAPKGATPMPKAS